MIRIKYNRL